MQRRVKIITSLTGVMPVSTRGADEDGDELGVGVDDAAFGKSLALFLRFRFIISPC